MCWCGCIICVDVLIKRALVLPHGFGAMVALWFRFLTEASSRAATWLRTRGGAPTLTHLLTEVGSRAATLLHTCGATLALPRYWGKLPYHDVAPGPLTQDQHKKYLKASMPKPTIYACLDTMCATGEVGHVRCIKSYCWKFSNTWVMIKSIVTPLMLL
jgi:hypothetical protein